MTLTDAHITKILATDEVRSWNGRAKPEECVSRDRVGRLAELVFAECDAREADLRSGTLSRHQMSDLIQAKLKHRGGEFGFVPLWAILIAAKVILLIIEIWFTSEKET
jgi:hypothetical protein